jgi:ketosteroid isomerase-like protein
MSQENVENSERVWAMFMAGEIESMLAFVDQKAEIHDVPEIPGARVFHGPEGWRQQIEGFSEAFTDLSYRRLESIDCGETVIGVIHATGAATSSGIPGEVTYAQAETWRNGKIVLLRYFISREAALEAVGLSE